VAVSALWRRWKRKQKRQRQKGHGGSVDLGEKDRAQRQSSAGRLLSPSWPNRYAERVGRRLSKLDDNGMMVTQNWKPSTRYRRTDSAAGIRATKFVRGF